MIAMRHHLCLLSVTLLLGCAHEDYAVVHFPPRDYRLAVILAGITEGLLVGAAVTFAPPIFLPCGSHDTEFITFAPMMVVFLHFPVLLLSKALPDGSQFQLPVIIAGNLATLTMVFWPVVTLVGRHREKRQPPDEQG